MFSLMLGTAIFSFLRGLKIKSFVIALFHDNLLALSQFVMFIIHDTR